MHQQTRVPAASRPVPVSPPLMNSVDSPKIISTTRRNGKPYSCEPCRRGKLRCDHTTPVCGRCARRGKQDQCIYHPAPLTKPRPSSDNALGSRRSSQSVEPNAPYPPLQPREDTGLKSPPLSRGPSSGRLGCGCKSICTTPSSHSPNQNFARLDTSRASARAASSSVSYTSPESAMSFRDPATGFLGPTSYSAVFTENEGRLGVVDEDIDHEKVADLPPIPAERIAQGTEVLALLKDLPAYLKLAERWIKLVDGFSVNNVVFRLWIENTWSEFGPLLQESSPAQLQWLSELVWRNTRQPMNIHGQLTMRQWAINASGRNLRWEVVGTILAMVGAIAANNEDLDSIFDELESGNFDKLSFPENMRKAAEFCLCYCYECESFGDVQVACLFVELALMEDTKGNSHYAVWQRCGELSDAVIAMGLHQGNPVDAKTPFWLSETRKKMFLSCYARDKGAASFLGRPPRLSFRYCKIELPLDLSDEELALEGEELEKVVRNLDPNGWSRSGNIRRVTWLRDCVHYYRVREEILEIALGPDDTNIAERADYLRRKLDQLDNPAHFRIMNMTPEEAFDRIGPYSSEGPSATAHERFQRQINAVITLNLHTGVIHTDFLLQRALVNRGFKDHKGLIPISRRMLSLCLLAGSKRELYTIFKTDLVYLLATRGLPAAGVLAIELLKQEQTRQYTPDILPRSEVIQDLSVFISALANVSPGEGNFAICQHGRRALRKILDQILSPPPPPPATANEQPLLDDMSYLFPTGNDADFLQWLENVEWEKGSWTNAGTAPESTI